jgi:hypothetical protein
MKPSAKSLLLLLIPGLLSSCYNYNAHQSGKTLGKGNHSIQLIAGVSNSSSFNDRNKATTKDFISPRIAVVYGATDYFDFGFTIGASYAGLITKIQFMGSQRSKFAASTGINLKGYAFDAIVGKQSANILDIPLYLSYNLSKHFTTYLNPALSYYNTKNSSSLIGNSEWPEEYFTKGAALGIIFNMPDDLKISIEGFTESEIHSNNFVFNTTIGVSFTYDWIKERLNFLKR